MGGLSLLKKLLVSLLQSAGTSVRPAASEGVQVFGRVFSRLDRRRLDGSVPVVPRGMEALRLVLELSPRKIVDVGAGSLTHSYFFAQNEISTTAIDFGTSIYAAQRQSSTNEFLTILDQDFSDFHTEEQFDLLFCSHTLEHQRNVGSFLEHCDKAIRKGGYFVFVLPYPHWDLQGGHISQMSPRTVLYNLVLAGIDCSQSKAVKGVGEFTIVVRKQAKAELDELGLTMDRGDVGKLSRYLPPGFNEGSSAYEAWDSLTAP